MLYDLRTISAFMSTWKKPRQKNCALSFRLSWASSRITACSGRNETPSSEWIRFPFCPGYGRDERSMEVMILVLDQGVDPPREILSSKSTLLNKLNYKSFIKSCLFIQDYVERIWPRLHWKVAQILFKDPAGIPAYKLGTTTQIFNVLFICCSVVHITMRSSLFHSMSVVCAITALYGLIYVMSSGQFRNAFPV